MSTPKQDEDREYHEWCVDGLLGNLPTRMSKEERVKARRFASRQRKEQELRQAELARLEKTLKPGEQPTEEQLGKLGLVSANRLRDLLGVPPSPVMEFIAKRLDGSPSDDDTHTTLCRAIADLLRSDVPLDRLTRALVADAIDHLLLSEVRRKRLARRSKLQAEITTIKGLKRHLMTEGLTPSQADDAVVASLGKALRISTVDALNKKIYRAKREGIS